MALVKVVWRGARQLFGLVTEGLVAYGAFVSPMPLPGIYPATDPVPARRRAAKRGEHRRGPHRCPPDGRRRRHYAAFRCAEAARRA
ncbi:hypothetical protein AB0H83_24580 [Dactylosporangium sp. NPDC050688]|uniref:hypothetical protein n=1 Tax=Dactylosporangium sp. NPDC050688 TaxID=3157217 RepID=UPI0033D3008B